MCTFSLRPSGDGKRWIAYRNGDLYGEYDNKADGEKDIKEAAAERRQLGDLGARAEVHDHPTEHRPYCIG